MNTPPEKTDIIILGKYTEDLKALWSALTILKVTHSIIFFGSITQLRTYLTKTNGNAILFISIADKNNLKFLGIISSLHYYAYLSIAVFDSSGIITNIEEVFAMGANIYIHKPLNRAGLNRTLQQVMRMNAQFASGNFNRETYFLSA